MGKVKFFLVDQKTACFILLITSLPLLLVMAKLLIKYDYPLTGAFTVPECPAPTAKSVLDGTFQSGFEKYFNYKMPGRPAMTRLYNRILYSVFSSTDTANIQIGKDGYLFQPAYPRAFLGEPNTADIDALKNKMRSMLELQKKLNEMGKTLFVIITPSKASLYPEYLPAGYKRYVDMKTTGGGGV